MKVYTLFTVKGEAVPSGNIVTTFLRLRQVMTLVGCCNYKTILTVITVTTYYIESYGDNKNRSIVSTSTHFIQGCIGKDRDSSDGYDNPLISTRYTVMTCHNLRRLRHLYKSRYFGSNNSLELCINSKLLQIKTIYIPLRSKELLSLPQEKELTKCSI